MASLATQHTLPGPTEPILGALKAVFVLFVRTEA